MIFADKPNKKLNFADIQKWCEEHNETEWLDKTCLTPVKVKDENGKPTNETRDITFLELKKAFIEKFDNKESVSSMGDYIKNKKAQNKK